MTSIDRKAAAAPKIRTWLYLVAFLVFCMVLIGGATRLTDSGLSITEWQPVMGALPPLSEADWIAAFGKYQLSSEFRLQNSAMTLAEFKPIFWWEWAHRFLGRFIGVAFLLPFLWFLAMRRLSRGLFLRLMFIFVLGGLQGGLGWYMVSSGLINRVDVSQYRLAAHLTLAAAIFAALIWTAFGVGRTRGWPRAYDSWVAVLLILLVLVQIAAVGFVAGLDAGLANADWPKMDGKWLPDGLLIMQPQWKNLFENALTVQFDHRIIGYGLFLIAVYHAWRTVSLAAVALVYLIAVQIGLGVLTLWFGVPLSLALAHQAGAMLVLLAAVNNLQRRVEYVSAPGLVLA